MIVRSDTYGDGGRPTGVAMTLLDQTISTGTPVLTTPLNVLGYRIASLQAVWDGTLAGTWTKIGFSNSYVLDPVGGVFTNSDDPTNKIVKLLTVEGGVVNGTPGSVIFDLTTGMGAIQLEFTRSAGSGRLWVVGIAKS